MKTWELVGHVFADGKPVSDAIVFVSQGVDKRVKVRSDDAGRFQVARLSPGSANVFVWHPGYVQEHIHLAEDSRAVSLVVELQRGASIRGRIEGGTLSGRCEVVVSLLVNGETEESHPRRPGKESPHEFEVVELPPGTYRIELHAERFDLVEPKVIVLGERKPHDVVLKVSPRTEPRELRWMIPEGL